MQFTYRLVGSDAVDNPTRIDPAVFPELLPYVEKGERLFLVPKADLEENTKLLRRTGAIVNVGVNPEAAAQLPPDLQTLVDSI